MEKQALTLTGLFSTFKDEARDALVNGIEPALPGIKAALTGLTPVIGAAAKELAPALGDFMATAMGVIGPLVGGWARR